MSHVLTRWEPESPSFWQQDGKAVARRNLWLSIPALTLAFIIWQVWSVAVLNMPNIGFSYTQNQLFWLAALPALSGATLRIFYSFMVPIFGGRRWTAISTASLSRTTSTRLAISSQRRVTHSLGWAPGP